MSVGGFCCDSLVVSSMYTLPARAALAPAAARDVEGLTHGGVVLNIQRVEIAKARTLEMTGACCCYCFPVWRCQIASGHITQALVSEPRSATRCANNTSFFTLANMFARCCFLLSFVVLNLHCLRRRSRRIYVDNSSVVASAVHPLRPQ